MYLSPRVDPAISKAIKSTVVASIDRLSRNLTEVIECRLGSFAKRFSKQNGATVDQTVKKAGRESYTCKRKGNQQQLDHELEVLYLFEEGSGALKSKSYDKLKAALKEGTGIVFKRTKAIKLADKSEFGWQTLNEYLSDELASGFDDKKKDVSITRRGKLTISVVVNTAPGVRGSFQPCTSNVSADSYRSSAGDHALRKDSNSLRRLGP